ncbi:MAG: hypothetical protein JSR46_07955, partial [Verrucomicrobia bacterium]|nr:hypothetical protein [Verrucomicrobiota bacterium]
MSDVGLNPLHETGESAIEQPSEKKWKSANDPQIYQVSSKAISHEPLETDKSITQDHQVHNQTTTASSTKSATKVMLSYHRSSPTAEAQKREVLTGIQSGAEKMQLRSLDRELSATAGRTGKPIEFEKLHGGTNPVTKLQEVVYLEKSAVDRAAQSRRVVSKQFTGRCTKMNPEKSHALIKQLVNQL